MGGVSLRERSDGTRLDFLEVSLQVPHDDTGRLRGLGIRMFEDERSARITTDDDSWVERHPAQERQPELLRGVLAAADLQDVRLLATMPEHEATHILDHDEAVKPAGL